MQIPAAVERVGVSEGQSESQLLSVRALRRWWGAVALSGLQLSNLGLEIEVLSRS